MVTNQCDGCQRGLPIETSRFGSKLHRDQGGAFACASGRYRLELEPKSRDTWHQPEKRLSQSAPFVCGGGR
ncbi:hypothetical protein [Spongiibacter sp.]|uniref:hypothetical protein n=1 Tax=Spongiibacter sp. TaxID=2024860 RepID=UPI000C59B739|nr:hypothetical protein [Spongiibacter sp.]MBU71862.1 hypothetical protein [Spongiibacter sp.]HCP19608.1 hypothetical protein [Marinobacter nauticus]